METEIQRLSGCVLFGWDLVRASQARSGSSAAAAAVAAAAAAAALGGESADLASAGLWTSVEAAFRRVCYMRLGISERNPLLITLLASDIALPKLLKSATVMQSLSGSGGGGVGTTARIRSFSLPYLLFSVFTLHTKFTYYYRRRRRRGSHS